MARTKKHVGFGRWEVYEDGVKIAGPVVKEEAEAVALAPSKASPGRMSDAEGERAYWRKVNADLGRPVENDMAKINAILDASGAGYTEIERYNMKHQIEAVLKARGQRPWRSRNTVLPASTQAQAAA